jgi:aldose 1-epimerase
VAAPVVQSAGDARLEIDLDHGCRLASLDVRGHELLVTSAAGPIDWGCYPMAPYAGRVREGRFGFHGRAYELPRTLGGHAIHGTAYLRRWEAESDSVFVTDLGPEWPFPGRVRQEIRLGAEGLRLRLEVHAENGEMPASCGWHPWIRRSVAGVQAVLDFHPGYMFSRDGAGITTRIRRPVAAGTWDDCFGDVVRNPVITWPGVLRLELESTCPFWVVFTEREHALCVEPQTAPPDALNHDPFVVEPGKPLVAECSLRWSLTGLGRE